MFFGRQLNAGLNNFDDAYYAQKAKEMLDAASLWVVTFNGQPLFDNPPLPFWLTAVVFKAFGVSGYSAIVVSATLGVATAYLTYVFAERLFKDRWVAFGAAFVLIFPGIFLDAARRAMVDTTLAFFVLAALFCFYKAQENEKFYLPFGLFTAGGIMTKSVLGGFPLAIGLVFLLWMKKWKELKNPYLLTGCALALLLGFSWHLVNAAKFGNEFWSKHFGMYIFSRGFTQIENPFYFLGYARDMVKNYWPWLPVLLIGLWINFRKAFAEKDAVSRFLLCWIFVIFVVMSTSKTQTLRYIFMIFPALAMIVSKTISDWLGDGLKEKITPWLLGVMVLTVLFVNATPFQVKVTLQPSSLGVRQLAPVIRLNATQGEEIGNFNRPKWTPRHALMFYADRLLSDPVKDPKIVLKSLEDKPSGTWLTSPKDFKRLEELFPNKLYLIEANKKYAFFTSQKNRENIRYDFSGIEKELIR